MGRLLPSIPDGMRFRDLLRQKRHGYQRIRLHGE